jgi:predicted nucleic acid-binding Zn ribbon protein
MTKPLSELLNSVIKRYGLERAMLRERLPRYWAEVVGPRVAAISMVRQFEGGVLRVSVSEPTWRTELTLRREEIRLKLNALIGEDAIQELQVK